MNPPSNVRQTRSRTRVQQENADLNPGNDDKMSSKSSEDSFIPSMVDDNGGELHDCGGCNRPNNTERFMVQCRNCTRWYHFTCANVNTTIVRSSNFVCVVCMPREISGPIETTPSVISELPHKSSQSRARLERELLSLDEEKKLLEDLIWERIEKERALNERELLEKLEREKEFIARKHELLSQHDDEERRSERSNRSSQRCSKRTKDWVMQTKAAGNPDEVVIEQAPVSLSSSARHPEETCLGSQQIVHPS